ncbi:hypothetical protein HMPREF3232_00407 [Fannyhessea vaginae]|nr:hypothetical protein HMPREF3232_00407 [Fannyhessea vaginae]
MCLTFKKIINLYYANICTYFILVEGFALARAADAYVLFAQFHL